MQHKHATAFLTEQVKLHGEVAGKEEEQYCSFFEKKTMK